MRFSSGTTTLTQEKELLEVWKCIVCVFVTFSVFEGESNELFFGEIGGVIDDLLVSLNGDVVLGLRDVSHLDLGNDVVEFILREVELLVRFRSKSEGVHSRVGCKSVGGI
jgi:hypothetical protein